MSHALVPDQSASEMDIDQFRAELHSQVINVNSLVIMKVGTLRQMAEVKGETGAFTSKSFEIVTSPPTPIPLDQVPASVRATVQSAIAPEASN